MIDRSKIDGQDRYIWKLEMCTDIYGYWKLYDRSKIDRQDSSDRSGATSYRYRCGFCLRVRFINHRACVQSEAVSISGIRTS